MNHTATETPESFRNRITAKLNEKQKEAVTGPQGSVLVLAGAGSGKTATLTARIAWLASLGVSPKAILAVTFTNKAAEEMRKRLRKLMGRELASAMWIGTFHSICHRILRIEHEAASLPKNFAILDVDGQQGVVRTIIKDANIAGTGAAAQDDQQDPDANDQKIKPAEVVSWINGNKDRGISAAEISAPFDSMEGKRAYIFQQYERVCEKQGLLDFNDLMTRTARLLEGNHSIRLGYAMRFSSILVDEFQDTNDIQYKLLKLLAGDETGVMAVGDDDQSIYGWRGANPDNMRNFLSEFANERVIKLEQNYRSLPHIIEAANAIIANNSDRIGKTLKTSSTSRGEKIGIYRFSSGVAEAISTAEKITSLVKKQSVLPAEIAVLYRTNTQSRIIEQELNKRGIPVTVYGGFRFYERQEIKNVLAYLDLVCSAERDIAFSRVANFPPRAIGERTLEDLRQEAKAATISMAEAVARRSESPGSLTTAERKKQAKLEEFLSLILDLTDIAQTMPLSELMELVIKKTGIESHYMNSPDKREAEDRMENLGELISAAKQFEIEHPELNTAALALPEYTAFVQLMTSTSEADMERKNTVSLMTVHSSKGLEFDYIFLVGLEDGIFPHGRSIKNDSAAGNGKSIEEVWGSSSSIDTSDEEEFEDMEPTPVNRELEEERRLLYVAVTRAKKHIEISYARKRLVHGEERVMPPSRFLAEFPKKIINQINVEEYKKQFQQDEPEIGF